MRECLTSVVVSTATFHNPPGLAIFVPTGEVSSLHLLAGAPITLHPTNVCLLVRCLLELGGQVPIISGAFPSLLAGREGEEGAGGEEGEGETSLPRRR